MKKTNAAFTLVELMVSTGIIILISSMIFFNFPRFRQKTALDNAARELSLAIRDAQARAVAVSISGGAPRSNYGINLKTSGGGTAYTLFSDGGGVPNKKFDGGDLTVKSFVFNSGVRVSSFTFPSDSNPSPCNSGSTEMNILFYRPDPTTVVADSAGTPCNPYGPFNITLRSPDGSETRIISVWRTGQVSILP